MITQTGAPEYKYHPASRPGAPDFPLMTKGVIIRHMVLPGHKDDSIRLLHWIHDHFPQHQYLVSLLSQYTPYTKNPDYPQLNRRITSYEYNKVVDTALELGMTDGFMQQKSSAKEEYTPPFNLEGLWSFLPLLPLHLKHLKIHDNISDRSLTDLRSYVPLALSQQNKTDIEIFD